jgi:hypothetical protein
VLHRPHLPRRRAHFNDERRVPAPPQASPHALTVNLAPVHARGRATGLTSPCQAMPKGWGQSGWCRVCRQGLAPPPTRGRCAPATIPRHPHPLGKRHCLHPPLKRPHQPRFPTTTSALFLLLVFILVFRDAAGNGHALNDVAPGAVKGGAPLGAFRGHAARVVGNCAPLEFIASMISPHSGTAAARSHK